MPPFVKMVRAPKGVLMLARRHLFEFNDESWVPEALRALTRVAWQNSQVGPNVRGVVDPFLTLRESINYPYST